jgi:hypothetical protein
MDHAFTPESLTRDIRIAGKARRSLRKTAPGAGAAHTPVPAFSETHPLPRSIRYRDSLANTDP